MIILLLTALVVTLGGCRHGLQQTLTDMASELGDIVQSDDAEADVPSADVAVPAREEAQEQLAEGLSSDKEQPADTTDEKQEVKETPQQKPTDTPSESKDSTDTQKLTAKALEVDTTQMDSLQLAVYRHNKAIDDSISLDSMNRQRKNGIDSPVEYTAEDSIVYLAGTNMAYLYGSSNVKYQNMDLKSEKIYMGLDSSKVHATGAMALKKEAEEKAPEEITDADYELTGTPVFQMGQDTYENDTISFNFKTKKGLIRNVYTEQEDGFLNGKLAKRTATGEIYLQHGTYTTCDADHPDFYIALSRAKVRPGKDVVFGPAYLVVCDVPLPLAIPYGFFPFTKSYSSGFIMPTYGDESARGFYLGDESTYTTDSRTLYTCPAGSPMHITTDPATEWTSEEVLFPAMAYSTLPDTKRPVVTVVLGAASLEVPFTARVALNQDLEPMKEYTYTLQISKTYVYAYFAPTLSWDASGNIQSVDDAEPVYLGAVELTSGWDEGGGGSALGWE